MAKGFIVRIERKLLVFLLIFLVSFQIGARSISIHGYGNSAEEARYNASVELNRYIFGEHVISLSEVETEDNGKDIVSDTFKESISISTDGELIGVLYSNAVGTVGDESVYGKYKVTASIPESHSSMYAEKLSVTAKSIDAIYLQTTGTIEANKAKLLNLMLEIQKYDNLRQVAIVLGLNPLEIVSYEAPVTYQSVSTELQSILIDQETSITNEKLSQRDQFAIIELNAKLEANRKEQESLKEQQELNSKIAQERALYSIQERVASVVNNSAFENFKTNDGQVSLSAESLIEDILEAQVAWNALYAEYQALLDQEYNRIENNLKVELEALANKAYRTAEMSNGKPIERAVEYRQQEIDELKSLKDKEKQKVEELINSGFSNVLKSSYEIFNTSVANLNNTEFVYSSLKDEVLYTFDYDGNECVWNFNLELFLGIKEFKTESDRIADFPNKDVELPEIVGTSYSLSHKKIVITCGSSDAVVYYTTDNTTPDLLDKKYTNPFFVLNDKTVKARAYKNGIWSDISSYTANEYIEQSSSNDLVVFPQKIDLGMFNLPYENISGKKPINPPNNKDQSAEASWNEYLNDVDYYKELLNLFNYELKVFVNISYDIENDVFVIDVSEVLFNDGKKNYLLTRNQSENIKDNIYYFKNKIVTSIPFWIISNKSNEAKSLSKTTISIFNNPEDNTKLTNLIFRVGAGVGFISNYDEYFIGCGILSLPMGYKINDNISILLIPEIKFGRDYLTAGWLAGVEVSVNEYDLGITRLGFFGGYRPAGAFINTELACNIETNSYLSCSLGFEFFDWAACKMYSGISIGFVL